MPQFEQDPTQTKHRPVIKRSVNDHVCNHEKHHSRSRLRSNRILTFISTLLVPTVEITSSFIGPWLLSTIGTSIVPKALSRIRPITRSSADKRSYKKKVCVGVIFGESESCKSSSTAFSSKSPRCLRQKPPAIHHRLVVIVIVLLPFAGGAASSSSGRL